MKIFVKPGKREGFPKQIFEGSIEQAEIVMKDGDLVLSVVADDIYTAKATQRYTITLDADDRAYINQAQGS